MLRIVGLLHRKHESSLVEASLLYFFIKPIQYVLGQLVSVQAFCFTVSKLIFGIASDHVSPLRIISSGLAIIALCTVFFGYVSSFYHILFALACVGALQGASWVPATKLLAKWYIDGSYGKMFSILGCGSTTAGLVLPLLAHFYWRKVSICSGFATLIYSIAIYLSLQTDDVTPPAPIKGKSFNLLTFMWSPVIWNVALNYLFTMEVRTVCETWIPLYINENGINLASFQVLYEIGGILGNIGSGALLDHLCLRLSIDSARRIVGLGSTTLLLLTAAYSIQYLEYVGIVGFFLGLLVNASINIWCMIASQLSDSHISGAVSALISFIANFGSVLAGSPLALLIEKFGYSCFIPFFFTHIAIVGAISSLKIGFQLKETKSESE